MPEEKKNREKSRQLTTIFGEVLEDIQDQSDIEIKKIEKLTDEKLNELEKRFPDLSVLENRISKIESQMGITDSRIASLLKQADNTYTYDIEDSFYPDSLKVNYKVGGQNLQAVVKDNKISGTHIDPAKSEFSDSKIKIAFTSPPEENSIKLAYKAKKLVDELKEIKQKAEADVKKSIDEFRTKQLGQIQKAQDLLNKNVATAGKSLKAAGEIMAQANPEQKG